MIVSVIYHSPSQNNCEFDSFLRSVERLLSDIKKSKPFLQAISMQDQCIGGLKTSIPLRD